MDKSGWVDGIWQVGTANIMVSHGDAVPTGFPSGLLSYAWTADSWLALWGDTNNRSRGVFVPYKWNSFGNIPDGTSNTIATSEAVSVDIRGSNKIKGGVASDWNWRDAITDGIGPQNCLNRRDPDSPAYFTGAAALAWRGSGGIFDGICPAFTFSTVLPPNSPSCNDREHDGGNVLMSVTSNHTNGVNIGLCDGSVSFISETINTGDLTRGQNNPGKAWTGESRYGVWGALGTPGGAESKGLP